MELVTQVITIPAASTAKTAKIQFHQCLLIGDKGIYKYHRKPCRRDLIFPDNIEVQKPGFLLIFILNKLNVKNMIQLIVV